jgi:hypothetical protein
MQQEPTEQAEASIPTEIVREGPHQNPYRTVTVRRKAAKRSEKWYQEDATPLPTRARKKRRLEEPLLPLRRSSRRINTISSTCTATPDPSAAVNASTRRESPRQTQTQTQVQLPPIETIEAKVNAGYFATAKPGTSWEACLRELADYRKIHGHCNVPDRYSKNTKMANWVSTQRKQYNLHVKGKKGKTSNMTLSRIQELERLGFEWDTRGAAWQDRLTELADYRKIYGHCNIPENYSGNAQLGKWVRKQRSNYTQRIKGKKSSITLYRIQELESLGFEWDRFGAAWEDRLRELANYRKIHGHCNIPENYSGNVQLGKWAAKQRSQYRLYVKGKPSHMSTFRIQKLETLGFEWQIRDAAWEERLSELAEYRKVCGHCNFPLYSENPQLTRWVMTQRIHLGLHREGKKSYMTTFRIQELKNLGFE